MNTYNFEDKDFKNSNIYKEFMDKNGSFGSLKIRAYGASEAIPISGIKVIIYTIFNDNKIIFFEGVTNESGLIEKIKLPAPKIGENNLDVPEKQVYNIEAKYTPDNLDLFYKVNMYDEVCVVQNINIIPDTFERINYGY